MARIIKTCGKIARLRPSGFWPGFIVGCLYFSYIFSWLWSLYPLDTIGITHRFLAFLIIFFGFSISVICVAFFWGLFSFFGVRIVRGQEKIYVIPLQLASIFVLVEYLRTWGLGIVWFGSGSFLGPHWTLGSPAYLLSSLPWIVKTSSVWGIYGIDFIIIFLLSILALTVKRGEGNRKALFGEMLIVTAMLFVINNIPVNKQQGTPLELSVIQTKKTTKTNYSLDELLNDFSQKNTMLKNSAKYSDIVVFPETANFSETLSEFFNSAMVQKYFNNLAPKNILVIDSNRIPESSGLKSKVIFIDSKNGIVGSYDKKLLTPGGEFLPYILKIPFSIFEHFNKNNIQDTEFAPGSGSNILTYKDNNIKVLACSDIISPYIARVGEFDFMLDLSSLGMFNGNSRIANEMKAAAQFRAAENGKYLIMASNFGRSYVIGGNGNIVKSTDSSGYQILTASIVPNKERTWYNKLGDLPILLLSLAIFGYGLKTLKNAQQD